MKWSLRIATVSGIAIRVHATFALIVVYFAIQFGGPHGWLGAAFGAAFVCMLFACVALHELGHSLVAQRFGVTVREIVLLPIGGVARLLRDPSRPYQELLIALAGPAVNVVIAGALFAIAFLTFGLERTMAATTWFHTMNGRPSLAALLGSLMVGNLMVAVFNMVPALPMDGGRVFRAILAMIVDRRRATAVAATVGQLIAAAFTALALHYDNLVLALVGAFVFFGASQERLMVEANAAISELKAGDVCAPGALVLSPGNQLGAVLELMVRTPQPHFAVVHGDRVIGTLSRDAALQALRQVGPAAYITAVMDRDVVEVDAHMALVEVRSRIVEAGGQPVLVRGHDGLIGLIGLEDLSRISSLMTVLRRVGIGVRRSKAESRASDA